MPPPLPPPVGQDAKRHHDKVRALDAAHEVKVGQEGDGLQGLSQAHLVREDRVYTVVVAAHEPRHALEAGLLPPGRLGHVID